MSCNKGELASLGRMVKYTAFWYVELVDKKQTLMVVELQWSLLVKSKMVFHICAFYHILNLILKPQSKAIQ